MDPELQKLAYTLVGAVIGAVLTMYLGIHKTKAERRWSARHEAYSRIFTALEDVRFWAAETVSQIHSLASIGGTPASQAADRYTEALRVLLSYVHIGQLVIGERARARLEQMVTDVLLEIQRHQEEAPDDDPHEQALSDHAHRVQKVVLDGIEALEPLARADLR